MSDSKCCPHCGRPEFDMIKMVTSPGYQTKVERTKRLEAVLSAARDVSAHDVDSVQALREAIRLCDATTGEGG